MQSGYITKAFNYQSISSFKTKFLLNIRELDLVMDAES